MKKKPFLFLILIISFLFILFILLSINNINQKKLITSIPQLEKQASSTTVPEIISQTPIPDSSNVVATPSPDSNQNETTSPSYNDNLNIFYQPLNSILLTNIQLQQLEANINQGDFYFDVSTFPPSQQENIASLAKRIMAIILSTNNNLDWWKKLAMSLKNDDSLFSLNNYNWNDIKSIEIANVNFIDTSFSEAPTEADYSYISNQHLIFISLVNFVKNNAETDLIEAVWEFTVDCSIDAGCNIKEIFPPTIVKSN